MKYLNKNRAKRDSGDSSEIPGSISFIFGTGAILDRAQERQFSRWEHRYLGDIQCKIVFLWEYLEYYNRDKLVSMLTETTIESYKCVFLYKTGPNLIEEKSVIVDRGER